MWGLRGGPDPAVGTLIPAWSSGSYGSSIWEYGEGPRGLWRFDSEHRSDSHFSER